MTSCHGQMNFSRNIEVLHLKLAVTQYISAMFNKKYFSYNKPEKLECQATRLQNWITKFDSHRAFCVKYIFMSGESN